MSKKKLNNDDSRNSRFFFLVVYSSPFTGKTYNVDYRANWQFPPLPTLPPLSSFHNKKFNWNYNWMYNHGHGKGSGTGSASANAESATTAETTDAPKVESTTSSASHYSKSYSGVIGHKKIDIDVKFDFGTGGGSSAASSTTAKATKADDLDFSAEDDSSSVFDASKDTDIDPVDEA